MSRQSGEIARAFETAQAEFESARLQLIRCEAPASIELTLLRAGRAIEILKSKDLSGVERESALRYLRDLRAQAARIQLLLDTAAAFRCGVALAGPAVSETYSADGSWQTIFPNDQICLNA